MKDNNVKTNKNESLNTDMDKQMAKIYANPITIEAMKEARKIGNKWMKRSQKYKNATNL